MKKTDMHFEALTLYDDDTIRRMFRIEYYIYETARRITRFGVACGALFLALWTSVPDWVKVFCLLTGAWLLAARDFPSKVQAEGVIAARRGQTSTVRYRVNDKGIEVENGLKILYSQIDRLAEDERYLYIFQNKQTAVMLSKQGLVPRNPERLQALVTKKSGKQWKQIDARWISCIQTMWKRLQNKIIQPARR